MKLNEKLNSLTRDLLQTLIDSTAAVEKHWHRYGQDLIFSLGRAANIDTDSVGEELGVDPLVILQTSHGRRSMDVLKVVKPSHANWQCTFSQVLFILLGRVPNFRPLCMQYLQAV